MNAFASGVATHIAAIVFIWKPRTGLLSETARYSEISLYSYFYIKKFPCVCVDYRAGPVAEVSLKRGEISLTGVKVSPYMHSQETPDCLAQRANPTSV